MPELIVCDDACTFVSLSLQRYPVEADLAYGNNRGCFEKPQDDIPPRKDISCPDITPIELSAKSPDREAMNNQSRLVHPDAAPLTKYVMGTRYNPSSNFQKKIGLIYLAKPPVTPK